MIHYIITETKPRERKGMKAFRDRLLDASDGATSLAGEGTSVTLDSVVDASADPALARAYLALL